VLKSQRTGFPELPVLYWLFCENHQLFKFFQKPWTRGSLDCENTKKTGTGLKLTQNQRLLRTKLKNCTTLDTS
jgi:hypothetical protein